MSAITIGRLGLDTVDVENLEVFSHQGDGLTIKTTLIGSTLAELRALRQAALGLAENRDEPVVPFTWTEDSDLDGFYFVKSAQVDSVPASLTAFWVPASFTLQRIPDGFASPLIEGRCRAADRTNSHTIAGARSFHAVASAAVGYKGAPNTKTTRSTETGDVKVFTGSSATDHYYDASPTWYLAPASHYVGAAYVKIGTVATIGRQIRNAPTDWILGNGIVEVRPGNAAGDLNVRLWNGAAWEEGSTDFELFFESGGNTYALTENPHAITILRNTPEECRIRLTYTGTVTGGLSDEWAYYLDLRVRRGARFVECYLSGSATAKFGCRRTSNEAHSTLNVDGTGTGGIVATANDAAGNKFLILCPSTFTEIANGALHLTTANDEFYFGIGWELDGTGATGTNTAAEVGLAYYVAGGDTQRVVVR